MAKYSKEEKRAYYAGMGYRYGKFGKEMRVKKKNERSFQNGYRKAKAGSQRAPKARWAKK